MVYSLMKKPSTFRLSDEANRILDALASRLGLTRTAVLEMVLRERDLAKPKVTPEKARSP
jgi:predicted transcriptional regulator